MTTNSPTVETEVTPGAPAAGNEAQVTNGQAQDGQPEAAGSESSTETNSGAKGPSTSLEAAKAALGTAGTAADSPTADKSGTEKRPADAAAEDDKSTAIDKAIADKSVPFHGHPRWKEVTTAAKALESQVGELTPKAEKWDALDARFQQTGLAPEDVGPLFDGGAMLKRAGVLPQEVTDLMKVGAALKLGDREVVRQLAGPIFETLGLQLVEALPAEIQERIEQGALSEDDGRRLAQVQFDARRERTLRERAEQRVQQRDNVDNAAALEQRLTGASAAWEKRVKATDADFGSKEPHIVAAIEALIAQRQPTTEREVVAICQQAYDQVTRIMKSAGGAKPKPVTPARSGSSTTTAPVPRNSLEAARLGLTRK